MGESQGWILATMRSVRRRKYPPSAAQGYAANPDQHRALNLIQTFAEVMGHPAMLRGSSSEQLRFLTERLGESCLRQLHYASSHARRLTRLDTLPLVLQEIATRCATEECAWFARTDDQRIWFATAQIHSRSFEADAMTSLRFRFYEADGKLAGSGVWTFSLNSGWVLTEI